MMEDPEGEGIRQLEDHLKVELLELRNEIEENDLVHGIPSKGMSSLMIPKDIDYFRRERRLAIQRTLQVSQVAPVFLQADMMEREMQSCDHPDYSPRTLPLLLHQYFVDRMHYLVVCQHQHLLRWKRFCVHSATIENLYTNYRDRVQQIMHEYFDCSARAARLSPAKEGFMLNNDSGSDEVFLDDIFIYLRWYVSHIHSLMLYNKVCRIIQWFPVAHKHHITPELKHYKEATTNPGFVRPVQGTPAAATSQPNSTNKSSRSTGSSSTSSSSSDSAAGIPMPPPMLASQLIGPNPMSPTSFNFSMAAAGGGLATDERNLQMPLHTNDLKLLKPHLAILCNVYSINFDVDNIVTSADEMELYANINRKFRHIFTHQEVMKTFITYDCPNSNKEKWGTDTCNHSLLKEANWLEFIKILPRRDMDQVKEMTRLRMQKNIDELLRVSAHFLKVVDPDKVQDALRHHALLIQNPPVIHASAVVNHKHGHATAEIWKKIYTNPELYLESGAASSGGGVNPESQGKTHRRKNSYDFQQTMQMLGLEETDKNQDDPSSVQGAYLSFLHLRHLKIRDVQRSCLSYLNYFRAVQRMLTINDEGLSLEGGPMDRSMQNHRTGTEHGGHQGGGGTIGSHGYLYNSPRDFKVAELDFIQFSEVANHDDFFFHEEGRIHVRDQMGYYIIYDIAMKDYEQLEDDLLYIGTHFIEKDKEMRNQSIFRRKRTRADESADEGDFDISQYAHKEVDRYGVLYDLWCNECAFLESKKNLLDIYLECYHNTFDRDERRRLAQVMVNLVFQMPRIDFKDRYFILAYRLENCVLRLKRDFIKRLLDRQIEEQRDYVTKIWDTRITTPTTDKPDEFYGLPPPIVQKYPVAINSDESALRTMFLLEFHPSLVIGGRISDVCDRVYMELSNINRPVNMLEQIQLEKRLFEMILVEWEEMDSLGASYSQNVKRDLFNGIFLEDTNNVMSVAKEIVNDVDSGRHKDKKERQRAYIQHMTSLLNTLTARFRLIDSAWESEILSKIYRHVAVDMGYDEFHLNLRYIQFESAKRKANAASARPPLYITSIQEDDSLLDKFTPSALPLAIAEMDETHLGRFSFHDKAFVLNTLRGGVENLHAVLKLQLMHRNSLIAAVMLAHFCVREEDNVKHSVRDTERGAPETKSEKSTLTGMSVLSHASGAASPLTSAKPHVSRYDAEAFFSIQLEKTPSRDRMNNEFIARTAANATILKKVHELCSLKREMINFFCDDFKERVYQASLRAQLIALYDSIRKSLKKMPNLAKHYFIIGEPSDKKTEDDIKSQIEPDPRAIKRRPRRLLSDDGENVLNIWFVPRYREVLMLYRTLDDKKCTMALRRSLQILAPFHDILHYLMAHARLGTSAARLGTGAVQEYVTTDWGGTEGIEALKNSDSGITSEIWTVLRELQRQIDSLPNPSSPEMVADLLQRRRETMFLQFDVCMRYILRETFLGSGNIEAYDCVTENMHFALTDISDAFQPSYLAIQLPVPEPMEARDKMAQERFPFRSYINDSGLFPLMYPPWYRIEYNLQLCMAGLRDVDRPVVHGELLALNLTLEEVLRHGEIAESSAGDTIRFIDATDYSDVMLLGKRAYDRKTPTSRPLTKPTDQTTARLNTIDNPLEAYKLMTRFLILWKRLEVMKYDWGCRKLDVERIDTYSKYKNFCRLYKSERLFPLMRSLSLQYNQPFLYEQAPLADTDMYVTPEGVPEMVVKQRQLARLVEMLECNFILEVRKRVARQLDVVLKERNREEGNLPTDLWKRPAMKETVSMRRPTITEDFIQELMAQAQESGDSVTFSLVHLNRCLNNLSANVMSTQKETYENYAMFYENLLRHQHQLLYDREREVVEMRGLLKAREMSTMVDVQFQLAEQANSLILEVTALRAKVSEMRMQNMTMESECREQVRQEYNDMVHNLFSLAFEQKGRIDEYRQHLHNSTLSRIAEVRSEAAIEMQKIKEKSGAVRVGSGKEDELASRNLRLSQRMSKVEQYNIHLHQLMTRMKCMFAWRQNFSRCDYLRKVGELQQEKDLNVKSKIRLEMIFQQRERLLVEELSQLKEYLTNTEKELNQLRRKLDKELREKREKQHASERKAASDKQLASVKQMHIDKLMEEIREKNAVLAEMRAALDKNLKTQQTTVDKTYKEVDSLKKMLREERKLKQNAFNKVDDLLSQVYEFEATGQTRAQTANGKQTGVTYSSSRVSTANSSRPHSRPSTAMWPTTTSHPPKSLTPELRMEKHETRQRPKTPGSQTLAPYTPKHIIQFRRENLGVSGQRLRSRIAEQLLYNIEPDHHETFTHLEKQRKQQQQLQPQAHPAPSPPQQQPQQPEQLQSPQPEQDVQEQTNGHNAWG